jgi:hypothetical protein
MENTQDLLYSKNDAKAVESSNGSEIDLDLSQSTIDRKHFRDTESKTNLADEFLANEI